MMEVLTVCPLLSVVNREQTQYSGYLCVGGEQFGLAISLQQAGQVRGAKLECEWRLAHLLRGYKDIIQQRTETCSSLAEFLQELTSIVQSQLSSGPGPARRDDPPLTFYSTVIKQIEDLGWHRVGHVDGSFQQLELVVQDGARPHRLSVSLSSEFPNKSPVCIAHLPDAFDVKWTNKCTLSDLVAQFQGQLSKYTDFWWIMDDLDSNTWILEPEKPTPAAKYRRIALGQSSSVQVEIDPRKPRLLPTCHFLGADHVTGPLREKFNANIHQWDESLMLRDNLEALLEITFPSPSASDSKVIQVECGICYSYRLEEELPDQVCDDPRCAQPYHHSCLYEWLRALSTSRQSFNLLFGECPYCNKPITVKIIVH